MKLSKIYDNNEDIEVFVPKEQEEEFLKEHNITIKNLTNGITISSVTRQVEDDAYAQIKIKFPSASYHEPKDKAGITHILEHILATDIRYLADRSEAYFNASTSAKDLQFIIKGVANPHVKDYGIWPVLEALLDRLTSPLQITEKQLTTEKAIVITEKKQRESQYNYKTETVLRDFMYDEANPGRYQAIGNEESIQSITITDIEEYCSQVIIPSETHVSVEVTGNNKITKELTEYIETKLKKMSNLNNKARKLDENLYGLINNQFEEGHFYKKDIDLKNGQIRIYLVWIFENKEFTKSSSAMSHFHKMVDNKLFKYLRNKGISYTSRRVSTRLTQEKRVLGFDIHISKREDYQTFAKELANLVKEDVLQPLTEKDFKQNIDLLNKRINAIPVLAYERYDTLLYGLDHYDRYIDLEKFKEIDKQLRIQNLKEAQSLFINIPPTIIVAGDLSQ